jgi:TPR repeat protein
MGCCVKQDAERGREYFEQAADKGDAQAEHNLAVLFMTHLGLFAAERWTGGGGASFSPRLCLDL